MSLAAEASSKQALVIKVNGAILKFTIRTFALITGLNYVDVVEDFKFNIEEPNRLIFSTLVIIELLNSVLTYGRLITNAWLSIVLPPFILHMPMSSSY
uniref:Uncharacterized protein n=1 Tax=Solanum lycopersicum TaxID=4081 RepID=A0A3Q7HN44_SOLLC